MPSPRFDHAMRARTSSRSRVPRMRPVRAIGNMPWSNSSISAKPPSFYRSHQVAGLAGRSARARAISLTGRYGDDRLSPLSLTQQESQGCGPSRGRAESRERKRAMPVLLRLARLVSSPNLGSGLGGLRPLLLGKTKTQNTISGSRVVSSNRARAIAAGGWRMKLPSDIA